MVMQILYYSSPVPSETMPSRKYEINGELKRPEEQEKKDYWTYEN